MAKEPSRRLFYPYIVANLILWMSMLGSTIAREHRVATIVAIVAIVGVALAAFTQHWGYYSVRTKTISN